MRSLYHLCAIALLCLFFEIQFVLLLLWMVSFKELNLYGIAVGFLIFLVLILGLAYARSNKITEVERWN